MRCAPAIAALLLACACVQAPSAPKGPTGPMLHLGPERMSLAYDDPRAELKTLILEQINRDRAAAGVPPVKYDPRAALAGDRFCLSSAALGSWGHWDLEGHGPYRRWADAGGVDYHAENAGSFSARGGTLAHSIGEMLIEAHLAMMAERPPADGHRRTILDPNFTHVGIGVALVGGEFRMTEDFVRSSLDWIEVPSGPRPAGIQATFRAQPSSGVEIGLVEIRFEPPPQALTVAEIRARGGYYYTQLRHTLWAELPGGFRYESGQEVGFRAGPRGTVEVRFPLDAGAGDYYVLAYVRQAGSPGGELRPATGALVTAVR